VQQVEQRVFWLLAVLFPDSDMEQIAAGLADVAAPDFPRRRGNAVELLENLLDRGLRRRFLPLLEDLPRRERLAMVQGDYPRPALRAEAALAELTRDEAAWVRACAIWCLAELAPAGARELLEPALNDSSPVVREIALASLASLAPAQAQSLARSRQADDSPLVQRLVQGLLTRAPLAS
jgi:hypothetical protein